MIYYTKGVIPVKYTVTPLTEEVSIQGLITIFYYEYDKNYRFDGEAHDFWELIYIDNGEINSNIGKEYHSLKRGSMLLYPPNYFHSHYCNGVESVNMMILTFKSDSECLNVLGNKIITLNESRINMLTNIIKEAKNSFSSPLDLFIECKLIKRPGRPFGCEQALKLNLEMLLLDLLRENKKSDIKINTSYKTKTDAENVKQILEYLDNNVYNKISLKDVCEYHSMSPTSAKTIFKKKVGQSIMQYYNNLKIIEAKRLLRNGRHSVNEISEILSYGSIQYFCNDFKLRTNMTPSEYASSIKAKSI